MNRPGFRRALVLGLTASLLSPLVLAAQTPQLVDLGGYRLDAPQAGLANPPVIFIAGLGDPLDDWRLVWPVVAESATVLPTPGAASAGPIRGRAITRHAPRWASCMG